MAIFREKHLFVLFEPWKFCLKIGEYRSVMTILETTEISQGTQQLPLFGQLDAERLLASTTAECSGTLMRQMKWNSLCVCSSRTCNVDPATILLDYNSMFTMTCNTTRVSTCVTDTHAGNKCAACWPIERCGVYTWQHNAHIPWKFYVPYVTPPFPFKTYLIWTAACVVCVCL